MDDFKELGFKPIKKLIHPNGSIVFLPDDEIDKNGYCVFLPDGFDFYRCSESVALNIVRNYNNEILRK